MHYWITHEDLKEIFFTKCFFISRHRFKYVDARDLQFQFKNKQKSIHCYRHRGNTVTIVPVPTVLPQIFRRPRFRAYL
jgi:hypothetical protein